MPKETPQHINADTWKEAYEEMKEDCDRWIKASMKLRTAVAKHLVALGECANGLEVASLDFFNDEQAEKHLKTIEINDPITCAGEENNEHSD